MYLAVVTVAFSMVFLMLERRAFVELRSMARVATTTAHTVMMVVSSWS